MNTRKVASFLLITFAISAFAIYWILNNVDSMGEMIFFSLLYLWSPGLAAIVVQKMMFGGEMRSYGFRSGRLELKWLLGSVLAPVGALAGTVGVIFLMGNVLNMPGFGEVVFSQPGAEVSLSDYDPFGFFNMLVPDFVNAIGFVSIASVSLLDFLQLLLMGLVMGVLVGGPIMLGQEMGWRGLLQYETRKLGFQGSGILVGGVWGLWILLPAIFSGYFDLEIWGIILANTIALTLVLSYLSMKTGSVIAPAVFRGGLGMVGGMAALFIKGGDPMMASVGGVAGTIFFMFIAYLILINDKEFVEDYPELSYTYADAPTESPDAPEASAEEGE